MSEYIREYGTPGGIWLAYTLDLERDLYFVISEGGDEVFGSTDEQDVIDYCEEQTAQ